MNIFLVGGAVRDELLGLPVKERDYVVTGARPQELISQGFRQVGKDFPVFLHPKTSEEYALARQERKKGVGYYGFECHFSPDVTLHEDLLRRDLTINAMARDAKGQLIDPYGGEDDLRHKILRHVSPAFAEDPVRVLRLARFAARFSHLGFSVHESTRQLVYHMVRSGELSHLVAERVWQELNRALLEKNPRVFFEVLRSAGALAVVFPEIDALFGVPNKVHYHPEIDSGIHTLDVLEKACSLSADPVIRFAALVHDLGKAKTPINKWPGHHGHEVAGLPVYENLAKRLHIPNSYSQLAVRVIEHHLNIHRGLELKPSTCVRILEQTDAFRRPQLFLDMLLVCQADGCARDTTHPYRQGDWWRLIHEHTLKIDAQEAMEKGLNGLKIKQYIHETRTKVVKKLKSKQKTLDESIN